MPRFYFDRRGQFRGFSTGLGLWIIAAIILGVFALAIGYQVLILAPVIGLWALVIWLAKPLFRRGGGGAAQAGAQRPEARDS